MNNNKNLKEIFEKYDKTIDQISKEFIDELKNNSETYRDVLERVNLFEKEIMYDHSKSQSHRFLLCSIFNYIRGLMEKEKNDLLITNRS